MNLLRPVLFSALTLAVACPGQAEEVFGGLYVHDVKTPLTKSGVESGVDLQLGYRGGAIGRTPLQPYIMAAVNSAGNTNYAAVGISARFGDKIFVRPGLGLAIHTGSAKKMEISGNGTIEFGSRVLFEPEVGVGVQINPALSIEASWVHMSHAQLFSRQNPGVDNVGARFTLKL